MKDQRAAIDYKEGQKLLFESTYNVIPFNVIAASLLAIYLYHTNVPIHVISIWLAVMVVISIIRMVHCKIVMRKNLFDKSFNIHLKLFLSMTMFTGIVWGSIYFISIPYTNSDQLYIILSIYGGMSAGSTTSLAVYFPSFLAYTLTIFIPAVTYNYYLWELNSVILATLLTLFALGITIVAKSNQKLFKKIFFLTEQNKSLMDKFEQLSITDPLTGLYNRRHFTRIIQEEHERAKRYQKSFVLIFIDIDNFKLINDNFGHIVGDKFLIYMADYLNCYLQRSNDIIFRLGGDEFAALLISTSEANTKNVCEEIKNNFLKKPNFDCSSLGRDHQKVLDQISLCIGVVHIPPDSKLSVEQIIEKVDELLYQAKNEGKNQIKYINLLNV